ncbi:DUF6048 family protein [Reichenbachiella carrageenanivorans]|uniref:DUF6048 family protein n=1 Tax=Reichenbachiella carrageenanivorans TaxID=2979869 RepID=A0ABY6D4D9_9BACT|nr:DUF6048 family protein [Reichenbachiella carrageenanivorans]UXX79983.1 DUF6048 family protein [Reichenbachiella carrageenanivorans]
MRILRYITSLIFLFLGWNVIAQETEKDFKPSEIIFAADVVGLGKTAFSDETKLEFHSKIDFHYYYLAADFGVDKINPIGDDFDYSSEGTFFRVGPHINLMPYNKHRSSIFFGLMYAQSTFSDKINYSQEDVGWGADQITYANDDMKARWFEANLGINVQIAGPLYLGYTLRFKFAKDLSSYGELMPYEIPGFGKADKNGQFGFNYYVIYKLRFRDKPIPKRPVKIEEKPQSSGNPSR